ncbi:MAG: hypothetical protein ED557_14330 [Balneola sp.]|nr:MAG: hypothetical protein ED557_14330 [Balneola sp.]
MRLEILRFLYDGKIILGVFILMIIIGFFFKERRKLIVYNLIVNSIFIVLFVAMILIEKTLEYPSFIIMDKIAFANWSYDMLYKHSDKFIGLIIYLGANLFVIYEKLVFTNEGKESENIIE